MYGSFESGTLDSTNRQNLNTFIAIPISTTSGRGLDFDLSIYYNSLLWYPSAGQWTLNYGWDLNSLDGGSATYTTTSSQQNCGPAAPSKGPMWLPTSFVPDHFRSRRSRPYYGTKYRYTNYVYTESNGTKHAFNISGTEDGCGLGYSGTAGNATDGSGFRLDATVSQDPTARDRSGTLLFLNGTVMKDRNGNFISYSTPGGGETDYTDSAGHLALKMISSSGSFKYEYQDTTGTYQTVTLNLSSYNLKTAFACSGISEYSGTLSLPSSLVYPNGWTYTFTYEPTPGNSGYVTGRLSKVTLPNGGYVQYTFGTANDGINCSDGSIVNLTRALNDGSSTATWQYSRALNGSNWVTTVTAPQMPWDTAANQSVYTFNSSGQEITEQFYQGSSTGTLLRTINTTWATNHSPATKTTILENNSQSEIETTFDSNGQLTLLKEHDYGSGAPGTVLRTTSGTYLSGTAYSTANILDRITTRTVADTSGATQYREDFAYDGTTLSPCPTGVTHHDDTNYGCTYATRGNRTSKTTYTNAAVPSGGVTKNSYFDVFGNLVKADVDCCQSEAWTFSPATNYAYPDSVTSGVSGGTQLTANYSYNSYTGQPFQLPTPMARTPPKPLTLCAGSLP